MCPEHTNEESIFYAVLDIKSPDERTAYLEKVCGNNKDLLARIKALLEVHNTEYSFLEAAAPHLMITPEGEPLSEGPGTVIGRYKLLEKIGEGGMAVVYMAGQEKPIRRKVALKIIKLGMDTKSVIARFEAERQALAMMDHPNIAKVLDAGATETGRPYFVMELVKGSSITEYCDDNKLSTKERLELFIQVCNAVKHAHENGIIHRDIKPSNVMVTLHDSQPTPKVIDFGIAKATSQRLTEKTLFTRYAQMIGTPAYMSPEQAELGDSEIDMRTDIYSLGILLYEMLTGTTPFAEEQLRKASYLEMQRIICEDAPVKPSTKLSTFEKKLTDIAEQRKVAPDVLKKLIRGDLDWIVMKAVEKDRTRRYETANELILDIEHHLSNEPVSAGPPSTGYRLHKFVLRHRVAVVIALLVTGATLMGATAAKLGVFVLLGSPGKPEHAVGMVQRHVWNVPPSASLTGRISPDGRYLSYVDWTAGNQAARDLFNEISWLVTKNTDSTWKTIDGWADNSIVSPDGKQIAYSWCNQNDVDF
ncbi:MAG: protein kinase domain-containing protein, partial [Planctomycetota bacterium]